MTGAVVKIGDQVRYTVAGARATSPPPGVVGTVREVEPGQVLVAWPMGLGYEHPEHIRLAGRRRNEAS